MKNANTLRNILVISLIGILGFQAIWVLDSYQEKAKHLETHVQSAVIHSIHHYCNLHSTESQNEQETILKNLISIELKHLNEDISFNLSINNSVINTKRKHNSEFYFTLKCDTEHAKTIKIEIINRKHYIISSILIWIIISAIFIILLFVFTGFYIRSLNVQKEIQKQKDDFISNMTHELKTPISTIAIASEIIQNKKTLAQEDKIIRYSSIIHEENERLKLLIDRVMQVTLFENGKMTINKEPIDINLIISELSKGFQLINKKKGGKLSLNLCSDNPLILIDKTHFSNTISNLIENAIKYCEISPEICINTINHPQKFTIEIIDNGIGIPINDIKHIFNKYYRSKNIQNKSGFGLGLYYAYQVVKGHGGIIEVKSNSKKGNNISTSFTISIPY